MLAFRFCVVVSAGAVMILGYGVLGTSQAAIASSEVDQSEIKRIQAQPEAVLEPQAETRLGGDPSANLSVPAPAAASSSATSSPNLAQAEESDRGFAEPAIVVESNLPNTQTVLNAFTNAIADAPEVEFSHYHRGAEASTTANSTPAPTTRGNARVFLERVNAAIAAQQSAAAPAPVTDSPQAPGSPVAPARDSETIFLVESTLPSAQTVLNAFKDVAARSPDVKLSTYNSADLLEAGRIEADANANPPRPLSREGFTPFERILSHFQQHRAVAPTPAPPQPLNQQTFTPFASVLEGIRQNEPVTVVAADSDPFNAQDSPTLSNVLPETSNILEAFKTVMGETAPVLAVNTPQAQQASPEAETVAQNSEFVALLAEGESAPSNTIPTLEPDATDSLSPDTPTPTPRESIATPQSDAALDAVIPPEPLAPNANPLLRPAEIDDVEIDLNEPITLEEAVALALQNNPTLRQTRLELNVSQESLREALAAEYPTLSTQFNFSRSDSAQQGLSGNNNTSPLLDQLGVSSSGDSTTTSAEGRLELSYDVYTGGRRPAQIAAAERNVRLNQLEVERIGAETKFNTLRAYYAVQEADARVQIEQAAVADAERSLRDAQLLEQAGLGTRFDVLQAQVQLANNTQNLTNALSQQDIVQRELAVVLGLGQQVEVTAADEIETAGEWNLSLEETLLLAYQNRAELEQRLVQREINEQQRQIALAGIKPQLSLFANYNMLGVVGDDQGMGDGYAFGARLQWTLFDGGAANARAAQQETNIKIAESQFDQQLDQIRLEVEQAYRSLLANQENIQTASVALQLAQESLRLARLRFGAGVGTQTEVINAQTELSRARGNLLTAIINYNRDLAALQRAVTNLPDNRLFDLPQ
jgi:outer membrane protein TolC